jgi:hypothetical protein
MTSDDQPRPWEPRPISIDRWMRYRDVMLKWCYPGNRPQEWFLYERNMKVPPRQTSWLFDHDVLSEAEIAELMPTWREQYDRSWEEGFVFNAGERGWLVGAAARKAWYHLHDIPDAIVKHWDRERRRSMKVVKKLKTAAVPPMVSP